MLAQVPVAGRARASRVASRRGLSRRCVAQASAASEAPEVRARVVCFVERGAESPYVLPSVYGGGKAAWEEALPHLCERLQWAEPSFRASVFAADDLSQSAREAVAEADFVVSVGVADSHQAKLLAQCIAGVPCAVAYGGCAPELAGAQRLHFQPASQLLSVLASALPWSRANRDALLLESAAELVARATPNDFVFALLLLLDAAVAPVRTLTVNKQTSLANIFCMMRNCGSEVLACVSDPRCKAALDCLEACSLNDQVCSYRCIVSYESPLFEQFSLCVLQRHNCLGNNAERPTLPAITPMRAFRGAQLTHEVAESLLIGWLATEGSLAPPAEQIAWSWRVCTGQNPAYDAFPAQHQIFYRGKGRSTFWYDPVFRVRTLEGAWEWRRRHYRVKRGSEPGRFLFSVLDNGVTSLEHWAVIDVADDLSWGLFAYSGAASAAGQAYSGAVFATPSGAWPAAEQLPRVREAHEACGIKLWELYAVDNSPALCDGAPLALEE
jgi:hypothetical protein